ncbi:CCC motif membrane protein [Flavobacterium sp. XGLA_31]|uniref:CCC motif membrane protein n=1 Tax=Flavobacterium sp. XGLA_31 TaxID=3447666 RepID=UPI003F338010
MEQSDFSNFEPKQKLPNATAVLVLGILSIITFCCYGIIGLILGIVALILAKKDLNEYRANPALYTNYGNLNTGRILAIIGLVLSLIYILFIIWLLNYFGMDALKDPALMQEKMRHLAQ